MLPPWLSLCASARTGRHLLSPEHAGPIRILAAGNDPTRDWPTVLSAFGGDPRFELTIVSDKVAEEAVAPYSNLQLPRRPTVVAFQELYRWADFTVVPMVENKYSGITVALEARRWSGALCPRRLVECPHISMKARYSIAASVIRRIRSAIGNSVRGRNGYSFPY
jgi:hypothetical protein